MSRSRLSCLGLASAAVLAAACTNTTSATDLVDHGPPMVEQVRLIEDINVGGTVTPQTVFGFGTHPMAQPTDEHAVTAAKPTNQVLRIIMNELLVGNYLEEISCNDIVGPDGAFDRVPIGATPDDIAKCAVAKDVLPQTCTGDHAVCVCQLPGGCNGVAMGQPVGVLDKNQDGAADHHKFISGAVGIKCNNINVVLDLAGSYWNPSGDQQVPAQGGFDALGPAIVLKISAPTPALAASSISEMPTNTTCGLTFSTDVIDKHNMGVCAPPGGRTADCTGNLFDCPQSCMPGDLSAFTFKTEPLTVSLQGITDGDVGISRTNAIIAIPNAPVDPNALGNIRIDEAGVPYTMFTVTLVAPTQIKIASTNATGFAPNTMYTVTFPTTVTDAYNQGLPAPIVYHFTTGA